MEETRNDVMKAKMKELSEKEGFLKELARMETKEEIAAYFAKENVELSEEEIDKLLELLNGPKAEGKMVELSDDDLENIVGGIDFSDIDIELILKKLGALLASFIFTGM